MKLALLKKSILVKFKKLNLARFKKSKLIKSNFASISFFKKYFLIFKAKKLFFTYKKPLLKY